MRSKRRYEIWTGVKGDDKHGGKYRPANQPEQGSNCISAAFYCIFYSKYLQKDFRAFFNYDVIIFIMYLRKCDEQIALLHTTLMENRFSLLR